MCWFCALSSSSQISCERNLSKQWLYRFWIWHQKTNGNWTTINLLSTRDLEMHFYMQDQVNIEDPSNATSVLVAGPNNNLSAFSTFGSVMMIDNLLTESPSRDSMMVGRLQGAYFADSMSNFSIMFSATGVFPNGTLSFHGQNPIFEELRELCVAGGTGEFKYVTGYVEMRTYELYPPLSAAIKWDVYMRQQIEATEETK